MSGRKPRTNRLLLLIAVLLCLFSGVGFTQSSAAPSPMETSSSPDMFVAQSTDASAFTAESTAVKENGADDAAVTDGTSDTFTDTQDLSPTEAPDETSAEPTVTPAEPTAAPAPDASPEAALGVWTSRGSNWTFLVNGTPYTGWLYDTDGNHYYFNSDGIMQTGWLDDNGKRYYLNLDGIMQTGDLTLKKKTYHLLEDGSLEGYQAKEEATPTPEPTQEPTPEPTKEPAQEPTQTPKADSKNTDDTKRKTIALTFDDGPGSFSDRILDCLEANDAKATFFMVGREIESFPDAVKRMEALGCELGNHTYDHVDLTTLGAEDISSEIGRTDELLLNLVGHGATVVRPPYGAINSDVESNVGTPMVLWSVDTLDWETLDVQQTVDAVMSGAEDGAIILMHEIYETSAQAAEIVIPQLIEEGYDLVTVHELAAAHGIELKSGIAYGAMNQQ